jgi:Thioredoxin
MPRTETGAVNPLLKPAEAFPQEKAPVPVNDDDIVFGDRNAPLTAVIYGGYTKLGLGWQVQRIRQFLAERFGSQVRIVFKDFYMKHHADRGLAAESVHAAFAESPAVFDKFANLLKDFEGPATIESLAGLGQLAGANRQRFQQSLEIHKYASQVAASMRQVDTLKMIGSPTTFINGLELRGPVSNHGRRKHSKVLERNWMPSPRHARMAWPSATSTVFVAATTLARSFWPPNATDSAFKGEPQYGSCMRDADAAPNCQVCRMTVPTP